MVTIIAFAVGLVIGGVAGGIFGFTRRKKIIRKTRRLLKEAGDQVAEIKKGIFEAETSVSRELKVAVNEAEAKLNEVIKEAGEKIGETPPE